MWNHIKIIKFIKNHIPFWLRIVLIRILVFFQNIIFYVFPKNDGWGSEKKAFVLLSTDYSNLGDHAMTYAHIKFIKAYLPDYAIYEVLVSDTLKSLYSIKKFIGEKDIITLKGGGNIGVEYYREELIRRKIIKLFPKTRIIMFPQTVYFPDTKFGKIQFKKTIKVFNEHEDFYAFFRDIVSYDIISKHLVCHKYLTPDIVFSLRTIDVGTNNRHGAITCLRRDVEGIYSENDKAVIYSSLESEFGSDVNHTDTIKDYKILTQNRESELQNIWQIIANARLLVTDRLHGMIFAALLGTPCIVLNTYNHKLRAQYEWIKDLNYVFCIDLEKDKLENAIQLALSTQPYQIEPNRFDDYFESITKCLRI